ncbi:hypothetical protein QYE76_042162 [Lolium multiflorum]|uniref:Uncharacterized protein n=1 Tax=Lolium multiflorum TaxID=4521 RepID=A0AAD8TGE6_LOLMU|nr:hypothetical protein QYE76_042162 [Lolium multiflorum]
MLVMTGHAKKLSDLGIVIPNRLGINRVLQSLPPSYKNFVMNYNMQNMNKEFPELFGMLKAAEIEIKKEHQVLMVNKTTSFKKQGKSKGKNKKSGKKAATPPVKPKSGPKPDAECYYCKEKGQWKRNCSKYLADLKSGLIKKKKEVHGGEILNRIGVHSGFEASSEAVWMKRFIVELGVVPSALDPFVIYCDNMGAIANAQEPRSHKRLKHIKLRYHSIREYIEDGEATHSGTPGGTLSATTTSTSAAEMVDKPVTYDELTDDHKRNYDELKSQFEADLIGSFERTRSHGIRWKGFSSEGALDGVDLSLPSEERTRALRQEVSYTVAHAMHRHSESLVNAFERVALRVVQEIMKHQYSPTDLP